MSAETKLPSEMKTRSRTSSLEDLTIQTGGDVGNLKKSSSSIKTAELLNCDLNADCDALDKEIENLEISRGDPLLKVADSRFCDIFSRQSVESNENSSPDEERINFSIELIQHSTSDIVQLIPKKPAVQSTEVYQPCTNTVIQLKPSSFSAFREISEVKQIVQQDKEDAPDAEPGDESEAAVGSSENPQ